MRRIPAVLLFLAVSARATTLLIPTDRELIANAPAIVIATAGESVGRRAPGGWLETVTTMRVEEVIKGEVAATIRVTELGGVVGSTHYAVSGSPSYAPGERVLLFLETNARGEWVSKAMAVGKFTLLGDTAVRGQLCGWNTDGSPHVEPLRAREPFLQFVRDVAHGAAAKEDYVVARVAAAAAVVPAATSAPSTYTLQYNGAQGNLGMRWKSFPAPVVFLSHGTQPGATGGGLPSVQRGLAAWTDDPGSNVVYAYGGTTDVGVAGFNTQVNDGINTIQFNDPSDEIPGAFSPVGGAVLAVGGGWFDDATPENTHAYGGERFYTIFEADLVVQNGITGGGLTGLGFDHVLTHELGHTLGFRHSDDPPAGGTLSASAIMAASVVFNGDIYGSNLQAWDREAVDAVYGAAPPCTPPQITSQPQSVALGTSAVTLTVSATGDAPLQYQWYTGTRGNTARPVPGANGASINVQPSVSTIYWVRVSNGCTPPADSAAATVTVNGCPAVTVDSISAGIEVIEGTTVTLTASAAGATAFEWYSGVPGATNAPLAGKTSASIEVTPSATTSYWTRASNGCGAFADSEGVTVNVQPCTRPVIVGQPSGGSVTSGSSATLYAGITGTPPLTIVWYEGPRGVTTHPIPNGNSPTLTTPPLFAPTTYWVHVQNLCGSAESDAASVDVAASCTAPAITAQPRDVAVPAGRSATLTVTAAGTSLTYQWYQGTLLDFSRPVGGSTPTLITPPITAPTQFWVRITSSCGTINSAVANVTIVNARRRAAGR